MRSIGTFGKCKIPSDKRCEEAKHLFDFVDTISAPNLADTLPRTGKQIAAP